MRLIVFDIDGTLLDSKAIILASHAVAFGKHDLAVPSETAIMALVGLSQRETFQSLTGLSLTGLSLTGLSLTGLSLAGLSLAGEHAPDDRLIDSLIAAYQNAVWAFRAAGQHAETLFPGAAELIADLASRDHIHLALATGKGRRGTDLVIAQHGWHGVFGSSHTGDEHPSKPNPAMLHQAMAIADIAPADTIMIGDSPFDMQMAVNAGVTPIGVAWGHQPREKLIASGAVAVAEDFTELARLLG